MSNMDEINKHLNALKEKYEAQEQPMATYLEGLQYAKPVNYWDYIEVDTLLSLQKPRTDIPDENVFIMYHQVTELFFKMILSEINQIAHNPHLDGAFFEERVQRINRYFQILTSSFDVMNKGMEVEQYLKFRTTLTPASGFQSAQYRIIEICCTDLINLVDKRFRDQLPEDASEEQMFEHIYWQAAGKDHQTGKKSMTLRLFEEKYLGKFIQTAKAFRTKNLWARYQALHSAQHTPGLKEAMRQLDLCVNVNWPLVHYQTAETYLESGKETKEATGGSNWKKYMHPKYQRRIFYPGLWSETELANWGVVEETADV